MRENLPQWDFVLAAYVIGIGACIALAVWSWREMVRAERRRQETRR